MKLWQSICYSRSPLYELSRRVLDGNHGNSCHQELLSNPVFDR